MGTPDTKTSDTSVGVSSESNGSTTDWEKRYKDTQAAYTRSRQENIELKAKLSLVEPKATVNLSDDVKAELEDLKYSDPDQWKAKLDEYEAAARKEFESKLADKTKQLSDYERRQLEFAEFQASHPDITLTDEVIKYDVPPRITKKLEEGSVTFTEFLEEAYAYLKAPKIIGTGNETMGQPNLKDAGGGRTPSEASASKDSAQSYKNEIY
jgi:hypothetical protein